MKRLALHGSLLAATFACSLPAYAQTAAQPTTPTTAAENGANVAKPGVADSSDTRGASMRAYQAALDKQKLGPSVPLSLARIRDELGTIEEKVSAGRRDEAARRPRR